MIRLFAKKQANPFSALKAYIKKTDDKELDAKVCIVEKYGCRIPELVKCLERCSERDDKSAGNVALKVSAQSSVGACWRSFCPVFSRLHTGDGPQSQRSGV